MWNANTAALSEAELRRSAFRLCDLLGLNPEAAVSASQAMTSGLIVCGDADGRLEMPAWSWAFRRLERESLSFLILFEAITAKRQ